MSTVDSTAGPPARSYLSPEGYLPGTPEFRQWLLADLASDPNMSNATYAESITNLREELARAEILANEQRAAAEAVFQQQFAARQQEILGLQMSLQNAQAAANSQTQSLATDFVSALQRVITQETPVANDGTTLTGKGSLKVEIPTFSGRFWEDIHEWLDILEDALNASQTNKSIWTPNAALFLREEARQWYRDLRKAAADVPPIWTVFKAAAIQKFFSDLRSDELRLRIENLRYKSLEDYTTKYRRLIGQLPGDKMTFDDRRHYYLKNMPPVLAARIRQQRPADMEALYSAARDWERVTMHGYGREGNKSNSDRNRSNGKNDRGNVVPVIPPIVTPPTISSNVMPYSSNSAVPMDVDAINTSSIRCYECNQFGHYARDCPRRRNSGNTGQSQNNSWRRINNSGRGSDQFNRRATSRGQSGNVPRSNERAFVLQASSGTDQDQFVEGFMAGHGAATSPPPNELINALNIEPLVIDMALSARVTSLPMYSCTLATYPAFGLIDTACQNVLIDKVFVDRHAIHTNPLSSPITARSASGHSIVISHTSTLDIDFQGFKTTFPVYVVPDLNVGADIIFGLSWLDFTRPVCTWTSKIWTTTNFEGQVVYWKPVRSESSDTLTPTRIAIVQQDDEDDLVSVSGSEDNWVLLSGPEDDFVDALVDGPVFYATDQQVATEFVTKALAQGVIEPFTSPWSSPMPLIPNGNAVTVKNSYPLPFITDSYQFLHGSKFFTLIDLTSGFWQNKTAVMNDVLREHLDKYCLVYLDDIIIFSKSPQEHLLHLNAVLQSLQDRTDALSRMPSTGAMSINLDDHYKSIVAVHNNLKRGGSYPNFVPMSKDLVQSTYHDIGHPAAWIPDLYDLTDELIEDCLSCQFARPNVHTRQVLRPIPQCDAFDLWHLDFVGPLPRTRRGNRYIITGIDSATDWSFAIALPAQSATAAVAFVSFIISERVLTDNGSEFLSYEFQAFLNRYGIAHIRTSPYHPQTNGRIEVFHRTLKDMLRRLCSTRNQDRWDDFLGDALLGHQSHLNKVLGCSPFCLSFGREPTLPSQPVADTVIDPPLNATIAEMQQIRRTTTGDLESHRQAAVRRANIKYGRRARVREDRGLGYMFQIGDTVLRRDESPASTLHPRWEGPFIVAELAPNGTALLATPGGYLLNMPTNTERLKLFEPVTSGIELFNAPAATLRQDAERRRQQLSPVIPTPPIPPPVNVRQHLADSIRQPQEELRATPAANAAAPVHATAEVQAAAPVQNTGASTRRKASGKASSSHQAYSDSPRRSARLAARRSRDASSS